MSHCSTDAGRLPHFSICLFPPVAAQIICLQPTLHFSPGNLVASITASRKKPRLCSTSRPPACQLPPQSSFYFSSHPIWLRSRKHLHWKLHHHSHRLRHRRCEIRGLVNSSSTNLTGTPSPAGMKEQLAGGAHRQGVPFSPAARRWGTGRGGEVFGDIWGS